MPDGQIERFSGDDRTGLGWCSPAYGRVDRSTTIRIAREGEAPFWLASVFDLDRNNRVVRVDWVPVWAEAGAIAHATAIRIERTQSIDYVAFADPADSEAATKPLWRAGDVETDARMLFYRSTRRRLFACVGLVDGSIVRAGGRGNFDYVLPASQPTYFARLNDSRRTDQPCAASPVS